MIVRFHRAAELELTAAVKTGEERAAGLGAELLDEVERVVALLSEFPHLGIALDERRRKFPLRRFPFSLIFRAEGDVLRILALAHHRRLPNYWRQRR